MQRLPFAFVNGRWYHVVVCQRKGDTFAKLVGGNKSNATLFVDGTSAPVRMRSAARIRSTIGINLADGDDGVVAVQAARVLLINWPGAGPVPHTGRQ